MIDNSGFEEFSMLGSPSDGAEMTEPTDRNSTR